MSAAFGLGFRRRCRRPAGGAAPRTPRRYFWKDEGKGLCV